MDKKKESDSSSPDWVRCQSKSRPDRYYMFNKKTGETSWCPNSETTTPQKTISAKDILKTPAQDRLKRLQTNLQKKKLSEPIADTKKSSRRKKLSKQEKHIVRDLEKSSEVKSVSSQSLKEELGPKRTTTEKDSIFLNPLRHKAPASVQSRLDIAKEKDISSEPKTVSKTVEHKFVIPKKPRGKTESEGFEGPKNDSCTISLPTELRIEPKHPSEELYCNAVERNTSNGISALEKTVFSAPSTGGSHLSLEESSKSTKYDVNSNETPSEKAQKSGGYFGIIKEFYNKIIKVATRPKKRKAPADTEKEKQVNLSINSKASFKVRKKPETKNFLRGILQENESGSIEESEIGGIQERESGSIQRELAPFLPKCSATSPKVSSPIPVKSESANSRLQRLRNSLKLQQAPQNMAPTPAYPTSSALDFVSKDSHVPSSITSSNVSVSECEPMDWQPISEEYASISISSPSSSDVCSEDSFNHSEHYDTVNENLLRLAAEKKQQKHWKPDHFYFVVDTNVFLQNITFVEELTTMKLCDTLGTVIYVPYCVLQELDKLKIRSPSESIKLRSARAIKYLNKAFDEKVQSIQAQSAADEAKHLIKVTSPDDSILNCCLQVKEHIDNVLLLTEDINLQNKAMCCDVLVSTKSDLISKH